MDTSANFSPHDLLPAPEPCTMDPPPDYFYDNVAKHLIKDTVRIMNNGLPIDLSKVRELELSIDAILAEVAATLASNPYVDLYQQQRHKSLISAYVQDRLSKCRQPSYYLKPFDSKKLEHRSYFMHVYATEQNIEQPSDLLPTGIAKWPANLVKRFAQTRPVLQRLLDDSLPADHPTSTAAMNLLAKHKADLYNKSYLSQAKTPEVPFPEFNPNSSTQLRELFSLIGITSEATSKTTGEESWDRKQIERVNSETDDPDLKSLTQALIDFSSGNIIKVNFIPAFYRYTVDGKLHGTYRLFGAKSFRYTSQNPNLLNAPSTNSIYAKPVKRCFIAPDDFLVYAIDLSALEDRVMASLSRDKNKCSVFTDGLDG